MTAAPAENRGGGGVTLLSEEVAAAERIAGAVATPTYKGRSPRTSD